MRIDIEESGSDQAARGLERLAARAGDLRPVFRRAGDEIAGANVARVQAGRGMRRLAPATAARKQRLGQPSQPLQATGGLLASLRAGGAGNVLEVSGDELVYGTNVFYARFHQRAKRIPRRAVIAVGRPTRSRLVDMLSDYITGANR